MPSHETERSPGQERRMSRRSLLHGAAAAGAAGLAVTAMGAAASPAFASVSQPASAGHSNSEAPSTTEPIVVHVRDAKSGDIEVFSGTSQTRLSDPDLAARIARAIG
jgi:nitrous oxide reductase